jgi:hypothetical protein
MLADISWTAAQRNRSTSRKRGHDESEGVPGSSMAAYSGAFSSPQSMGGKSSPHSSPASVNLPSPSTSTMETTQQQEGALTSWVHPPITTRVHPCHRSTSRRLTTTGCTTALWGPQVVTNGMQTRGSAALLTCMHPDPNPALCRSQHMNNIHQTLTRHGITGRRIGDTRPFLRPHRLLHSQHRDFRS